MITLIAMCEVGFWLVLLAGLAARNLFRARRLSNVLLTCVPLVDVMLLIASIVDLRRGAPASPAHGIAAIYLGLSVAFGPQVIRWADRHVAHRVAGGPRPPRPPRYGRAHAARERAQWLRHLLAYLVAAAVLGFFTLLVGDIGPTTALWAPMAPWTIALAVDFIVSFSYTLALRTGREKAARDGRAGPRPE